VQTRLVAEVCNMPVSRRGSLSFIANFPVLDVGR
jgi:hypothetical protein